MRAGGAVAFAVLIAWAPAGCKSPTAIAPYDAGATRGDGGVSRIDAGRADGGREAASEVSNADSGAPPDDAMPDASNDMLASRGRHLLEAIAKDDGNLAVDILFPRDGWMATRDTEDPGKDWDHRVTTPFRKALHAIARRHPELDHAQFVSLEIGPDVVQGPVRHHKWKKPLWTVRNSHLTYVVDGHTRVVVVHEMVAWRGAWYVTRL